MASRATHAAVVAAALALATPAAHAAPKRTLAQLIELARSRADTVAMAEGNLAVRRSQRSEALSYWEPTGTFTYTITGAPAVRCQGPTGDPRSNDPDFRVNNCVETVDPTAGNAPISFLSLNLAGVGMQLQFDFTQPLFTFGKIGYGVSAANHGIAAGEAQVAAARDDVEVQVARAYWGVKAARTAIATIEDGKGELEPWRKRIADDLDSDKPKFTLSDLKRLEYALIQLDLLVADLKRGERTGLAGLRSLVHEDVDVDDTELDLVAVDDKPAAYYEDAAVRSRPEVRALDEGADAYWALARLQRANLLPDLALTGGLQWRYAPSIEDANNAFFNHANGLSFGLFLALRQPLDFGQRVTRWKHAEADAKVFEAQRRGARSLFTFEAQSAWDDLQEARERTQLLDEGQRKTRGWFTALSEDLDSDPNKLVEAARAYFEARLRWFQAMADANVAAARLARASGVAVVKPAQETGAGSGK